MYKSGKVFRDSTTFSTPENYVTVQIRNKNIKKKFSHHRSSVLHQIQATQSILNNSLTKLCSHVKSPFLTPKDSICQLKKKKKQSQFSYFLKEKQKKLQQNRRKDVKCQPKFRICQQIQNKLKQITNISYHFDQACVQKAKKLKTQASDLSTNYLLPNLDEKRDNAQIKKNLNQKKIPKNWIRKLRNGKSLVEKLKKKLSHAKLEHQSPLEQQAKTKEQQERELRNEMQQIETEAAKTNKMSLRDLYYRKQDQRKSDPISNRSNTFYKLFCSVRGSKQQPPRQKIQVQAEDVRKLQQFVRGVEMSEFKEHQSLIHMGEFIKDRQNFKVLKKMYNYVKEKYAYQFKIMDMQSMNESNLLSLVYYLENKNSMTELQKKNWKSKMNFIE